MSGEMVNKVMTGVEGGSQYEWAEGDNKLYRLMSEHREVMVRWGK